MSFFGKEYTLESQENFDNFINSMPLPEDYKKAIIDHKATSKITKSGDSYTLYSSRPNNTSSEVTFKSGEDFTEKISSRIESKTTITVDGNTVTQVQKFPDGGIVTFTRVYGDNELVVTITSSGWDGTARRVYKS